MRSLMIEVEKQERFGYWHEDFYPTEKHPRRRFLPASVLYLKDVERYGIEHNMVVEVGSKKLALNPWDFNRNPPCPIGGILAGYTKAERDAWRITYLWLNKSALESVLYHGTREDLEKIKGVDFKRVPQREYTPPTLRGILGLLRLK